jgi:hypothetical protein
MTTYIINNVIVNHSIYKIVKFVNNCLYIYLQVIKN